MIGHWIRRWGPSILGAACLWFLSTQIFSDVNTGKVVVPLLKWLYPSISPQMLRYGHKGIRKLAHITVYFIFSAIVFRSVRDGRKGWERSWALWAMAACAGYAVLDETHQLFEPMRHGSVRDVLLDSFGAGVAQVMIWRRRRNL